MKYVLNTKLEQAFEGTLKWQCNNFVTFRKCHFEITPDHGNLGLVFLCTQWRSQKKNLTKFLPRSLKCEALQHNVRCICGINI